MLMVRSVGRQRCTPLGFAGRGRPRVALRSVEARAARVKRNQRGGNNVGNAAKVRGVVNQENEHRRP